MVAGSQGMIALGQVKQPMKCVQSSPLLDPGAVPESGSLQSKPNIVTAGPRGDYGLDDTVGRLGGNCDSTCRTKGP